MIFIRDKVGVNLADTKNFLRNIFMSMFTRYAEIGKESSKQILNVVDDLINFNGDLNSKYLDKKDYGILSLPLTVANFMNYIC